MARYITPELRELIEEAKSGSEIEIALVPVEKSSHDLKSRTHEYGLEVLRELPSGVLLVSGPAETLSDFLDTNEIASASKPDRAEVLN